VATSTKVTPEALLLDLDGVVRIFDPTVAAAVEQQYGLPEGSLAASAFASTRIRPALVGDESHGNWLESVALDLGELAGGVERARAAVDQWNANRGTVNTEVLDFVREVRAEGVPVGLATNSTGRLDADLDRLGLTTEFDAVINSSVVRAHKPTAEFFRLACVAVGVAPSRCLHVDDDDRNVRGARAAGLSAYRFTSVADLPYVAAALRRG
jgi:putative hydrolase of the HAD superfamily